MLYLLMPKTFPYPMWDMTDTHADKRPHFVLWDRKDRETLITFEINILG